MIVLRTPKGWTGPAFVDGVRIEGTFRAHQVPLAEVRTNADHLALLADWMRSYRPDELFAESGAVHDDIAALAPLGDRRMGANPHANGGRLTVPLDLPDIAAYAAATPRPGGQFASATGTLGPWLRDVIAGNPDRFRIMGPDETASNRLSAVFEVTNRAWMAETTPEDDHLAPDGRVMEVLSEHLCEGWLEGYLLSGRHGLFNCYEAFTHIVDSMFNQHAKWLKVSRSIDWRAPCRRSTTCCRVTCGVKITTGSPIKTPASSTMWRPSGPKSCASTCRPTPTACSRSPTIACAAATTST